VGACHHDEDPEESFARTYAKGACEAAEACDCKSLGYGSYAACEDFAIMIMHIGQIAAQAADAEFDEACYHAHLQAFQELGCGLLSEIDGAPETCLVYHGDKGMGEACTRYDDVGTRSFMNDCEQGLSCAWAGSVCLPPDMFGVVVGAGEVCTEDGKTLVAECGEGLACDAGSSTCVTPAAIGEPCPNDYPCADSWCDSGTCVERKPVGSDCTSGAECAVLNCRDYVCTAFDDPPLACIAFDF
jgi:hypothetical protein